MPLNGKRKPDKHDAYRNEIRSLAGQLEDLKGEVMKKANEKKHTALLLDKLLEGVGNAARSS